MKIARPAPFLFLFGWPAIASAQVSEPSVIEAVRIAGSIELDGTFDEAAWAQARRYNNFTQREPDTGGLATERTEVAVLFDSEALFIGFWGFDSEPGGIRATEMSRDFSYGSEDNFRVALDPFDDSREGYVFVTNPNGARADALLSGGQQNRDWDGVWDVRSRRTDEGWFAEIRIPFSTLRFPTGTPDAWGINFERSIPRLREQVAWQGWSRDARLETLGRAGHIAGLRDLNRTRSVEARPYLLGGAEDATGQDRTTVGSMGADLSFLPAPSWKVNVTVHPDFAQVDADRQQVNLSRFSLFYPEKRTFFLEGSEFFAFDLGSDVRPFYSRRVGLAEDRSEVPILGGVRALGKSGGRTLGSMILRTDARGEQPGRSYGVFRWKEDLFDQSSIGLLMVGQSDQDRRAATYGLDFNYATSTLFGGREFHAGIVVAQSYVSDGSDRTGISHRVFLDYPNDVVQVSASWARTDDSFDPRTGFLRRSGFQRFATELQFDPRPEGVPLVRVVEFKPWELTWYVDDTTGELQSLSWEGRPLGITFDSGDSFEVNVQRRADVPDEPFELFEGAEVPAGRYWFTRWEIDIESYSGRTLSGSVAVEWGEFYLGTRRETSLRGRWKLDRHVSLSGDFANNQISFQGRAFTVDEADFRIDFAVNPNLFGAVSAQWNNDDDEIIASFRVNWIPRPGSDLFLVVNQQVDSGDRFWAPIRTTALTKLVWRIAL